MCMLEASSECITFGIKDVLILLKFKLLVGNDTDTGRASRTLDLINKLVRMPGWALPSQPGDAQRGSAQPSQPGCALRGQ
jgi:hypothetical protein